MTSIYLDHQATIPLHPKVRDVMLDCMKNIMGNPHSADHTYGWDAHEVVENARSQIADLISCENAEIVFTSGATEANNTVIKSLISNNSTRKKIVVSAIEHKCVLEAAYALELHGYEVIKARVTDDGSIDLNALEKILTQDVALVSIMSVNNEIGTIQPIKKIAKMARRHGILFHSDAAQSPMHSNIDVDELGVDFLSLSSHKMMGPKGIGCLYVSQQSNEFLRPLLSGGGQEDGRRSGTLAPFLCAGFGEAAQILQTEGKELRANIKKSRDLFWATLSSLAQNSVKVVGPPLTERHSGNLNVMFNHNAHDLLMKLQPHIAASTGSACASGSIDPSHVLEAIGLERAEAENCIRFSFGPSESRQSIIDSAHFLSSQLI
ncbi:MAG: cysteine desulfurase [Robiginitomaculum sp.]|nr:cysteine desulfurase [Robiginitomaculum sp.]